MQNTHDQEIAQNFEYFQNALPTLLPKHRGEYALLRAREIVGIFPTPIAAMSEGHSRFSDGVFSVQRVADRPFDLGFLSYGENDRAVA